MYVEHKKRGRPPLKNENEQTSSRMMSGGMSLPPLGSSSGRHGPGPSLPPLLPTPTPGRMLYPSPYGQPSIAQSTATARGQFSSSQRPLSFPSTSSTNQQAHMAPQAVAPAQGPMYGYANTGQPGMPYPSSDYPNPLFPRRPVAPHSYSHPAAGHYGMPQLQLPPILPAPPGINVDPAIAQQQRHFQPQHVPYGQPASSRPAASQPGRGSEERDPKRPKMDIQGILGPREQ
ncbi:hypothetical protein OHC33_003433 [Knufia fluminis]|uniref:Uncharacterized protein n=1 Tax=Knufia fluminis TaxID=191047 RepID=A0AAN8IQA2_9EURO|nr:hypothetical protein OHC33_003433 [Knufia fluminis]